MNRFHTRDLAPNPQSDGEHRDTGRLRWAWAPGLEPCSHRRRARAPPSAQGEGSPPSFSRSLLSSGGPPARDPLLLPLPAAKIAPRRTPRQGPPPQAFVSGLWTPPDSGLRRRPPPPARSSLTSSPAAPAAHGAKTSTGKKAGDPGTAMNSPHQGAALPAPPAT
jgi:hypothetical protein